MNRGFTLLEVLVATVIASLALSFFLYFLSEVHYTQTRARAALAREDLAVGELLLKWSRLSPESRDSSGLEVQALAEGGPYLVRIEGKHGAWTLFWQPEAKEGAAPSFRKEAPSGGAVEQLRRIFQGLGQGATPRPFGTP